MQPDQQLYESLRPRLEELEHRRRETLRRAYRILFIGLLAGAAIALLYLYFRLRGAPPTRDGYWPFWLMGGLLIVGAVAAVAYEKAKSFQRGLKQEIVSAIVRHIQPDLRFSGAASIHRSEFEASQLYLTRPDRFRGEDLLEGRLGLTDFRLSEIHAEDRQTYTDHKGRMKTRYVDIFRGVFMVADFHKEFRGRTFVLPDVAEKTLGSWLGKKFQSMSFLRPDLVYLEDPEFERRFVVYGDDQVEARYILSTAMMRNILDLQRRFDSPVRLAFIHSCVYVAIETRKDFLEPSMSRPVTEQAAISDLYGEVLFLLQIIDDLNLNTRIWSKQ